MKAFLSDREQREKVCYNIPFCSPPSIMMEYSINEVRRILEITEKEKSGAGYHSIPYWKVDFFDAKSALVESLNNFLSDS